MLVDPVSATGVVIAALALAHQVLKSPRVPKADKKKIAKEAERLVKLAQISDIDAEAKRAGVKGGGGRKAAAKRATRPAGKPAAKKAAKRTPARKARSGRRR